MMMLELFTVEEVNLICIFNTSNRGSLIGELESAQPYFDDAELNELAGSVLTKLNAITDDDFAALDFYPEYDDFEEV